MTTSKPSVVVIPVKVGAAPNLEADTKTLIESPLSANATIVPYASYKAAAVGNGFEAKRVHDINAIRGSATAAQITHAVVVESRVATEKEGGKSVKVNTVEVSLIDASDGTVLYTTKRTLAGPKLTRSVSTPIVAVIIEKLSKPEEAPVAVAPVPPAPVVAPPVAPVPAPAPATPVAAAVTAPADVPPVEPIPAASESAVADATSAKDNDTPPARFVDSTDVPIYPRFEARVGFLGLARDGRISGAQGGAVNYDGPLLAGALALRYYPFIGRGEHSALRGVGLYGEGYLTGVSSDFDAGNATNERSAVGSLDIGAAYRFPLSHTDRPPTLTFELGYHYATFPLSGVVFPGAHYSSMELGFVVDIPVVPHVSVFAGGRLYPWAGVTGGLGNLGSVDTAYAVRGELGGRYVIAPFEIVVSGRYQQYNAAFKGPTNLGLSSELSSVDYTDRYYGGTLSLGYLF